MRYVFLVLVLVGCSDGAVGFEDSMPPVGDGGLDTLTDADVHDADVLDAAPPHVDADRVDGGALRADSAVDAANRVDGGIADAALGVDASDAFDAGTDAVVTDAGMPIDTGPPPPPPVSPTIQIAAGTRHTCDRRMDGTVWCWGAPGSSLGNGMTGRRSFPVQAIGITDARDIAAGGSHTCATQGALGNVDCWGENTFGQIGNGVPGGFPEVTAVRIDAAVGSVGLALGEEHTCSLQAGTRTVVGQCWGRNNARQVGNPAVTLPTQLTPVLVDGFSDGVEIDSRGHRTCVLREDSSIWCWGAFSGGLGFTYWRHGAALAVGGRHRCTVTGGARSTPFCEGDNSYGQLGSITAVSGPWAIDVVAGKDHSCALYDDGSVRCWGRNQLGQLGTGTPLDFEALPRIVFGLGAEVVDLSAGDNHTCAVMATGEVMCWGANDVGQLGDGTTTTQDRPVVVVES